MAHETKKALSSSVPKPYLHAELSDLKGMQDVEIGDKIVLTIHATVTNLASQELRAENKSVMVGMEVNSIRDARHEMPESLRSRHDQRAY